MCIVGLMCRKIFLHIFVVIKGVTHLYHHGSGFFGIRIGHVVDVWWHEQNCPGAPVLSLAGRPTLPR